MIATTVMALIPLSVWAFDVQPTVDDTSSATEARINDPMAGLRIDQSNIVTAFHGHLTKYFGDCPGEEWGGSASKDNVRFIAYNQAPAKHLRVELVNLSSGEILKKKYTKEEKGSFDFRVLSLGRNDGPQEIQYRIYNTNTNAVLSAGSFQYDLATTSSREFREGEWRWEEFCASDSSDSIDKCEVIGKRERMYCLGSRTENIRAEYIAYRRQNSHKNKHHSHPRKQPHHEKTMQW